MSGGRESAESLFARYQVWVDKGEAPDFQEFVGRHPEQAEGLRELWTEWVRLGLDGVPADRSPASAAERVGILDEQVAPEFWRQFLERLTRRAMDQDRYAVEGAVNEGAMGEIHRVFDRDLRRRLAMKVMKERAKGESGASSSSRLGRFLEEAQVTAQLDHPGIVPVHELGIDDQGKVFFTMKLVKGEDLSAVLAKCKGGDEEWNQTRVLGLIARACEAIAYAHEKGVIHRDLKPSNVMVGRFGEVYVMDWGLSRVLACPEHRDLRVRPPGGERSTLVASDRKLGDTATSDSPLITMDGDVVGTPYYMPPEQAAGRIEELGPRSDVYGMGTILYQLLAGQPPYEQPGARVSPYTVLQWVLSGPPRALAELAPGTPGELLAICGKAMARNNQDRYPDMTALADDLRAYLENRVVAAYESGGLAELRKWVRRNRGISWTAAAAVVLLSAIFGWSFRSVEAERDVALARKAEFDQLAGVVLLEDALEKERELYPPWPEKIAEMEGWLLADAARLIELKPVLEKTLLGREVRASARTEESQRFLFATLSDLVEKITAFETDMKADVEKRLAWARRVEELTLRHPHARVTWEEARDAIAAADGLLASELYREHPIDLLPQMGLVPIGMNPRTKLWEFYHLRSAWDPASGLDPADLPIPEHAEDGSIRMENRTGIVFVLIPGGTFRMGAQAAAPDAPNFDPQAQSAECPVIDVTLDPYFLARHELARGQWFRLSNGEEPSWHQQGRSYEVDVDSSAIGWTHPVESVSWEMCDQLFFRYGLLLPTEAQWERGARGGSSTPWWTGAEASSLAGAANVFDCNGQSVMPDWGRQEGDFDDGFVSISRVGSFRANLFGLFDAHGNVWEWCRDRYAPFSTLPRPGDGLRIDDLARTSDRKRRGGSFYDPAKHARSSFWSRNPPSMRDFSVGVRPARRLRR